DDLYKLYSDFYKDAAFVFVSDLPIHMKQVINTNKCLIQIEKSDGQIVIHSVIDNLVKGASGQAVQNMNLMFGLDEKTGLHLKASAF
ncbi:MAG: N-acetyl-gamma-glutamyl-phosphate reductase, partial [Saprospiraceae bacterium]